MGIIVISAGCEVRSRVQGKSGDLSCHSAGGSGGRCGLQAQEGEGAAGRPPAPRLDPIPDGCSRSSSGRGEAQAGSVVPGQSRSPGVPGSPRR